jgi:hypothetical protein
VKQIALLALIALLGAAAVLVSVEGRRHSAWNPTPAASVFWRQPADAADRRAV